ncbi:hypothetical protein F5X99DRAFT_424022 [Biscogniauxia marginata]|nr:hypothetical protein F5X99DRAFT_424022 [Biscogniauxia marginata]
MKHQSRICQWLGLPSCTHFRTFLDLPAPVRRQIYLYAGLVVGDIITLGGPYEDDLDYDGNNEESEPSDFTFNVLQTCKAVNTVNREVSDMIYGENYFCVSQPDRDEGLELLARCKPNVFLRLRHLFIDLNSHRPACRHRINGQWWWFVPRSKMVREQYIRTCRKAVTNILSHSKPYMLSLNIAFDKIPDRDVTSAVLRSLLDFPGRLRDCAISLYANGDKEFSKLARRAVYYATGKESHLGDKPFRFLNLQVETRHAILQYTDLITPFREAQWMPSSGFSARFTLEYYNEMDYPKLEHVGRLFSCRNYGNRNDLPNFCPNWRSNTFSSRCRCWAPPSYLFLVCRAMCADAEAIFYSCNRIIVRPCRGISHTAPIPLLRLDPSRFITRFIWPEMLSHLRSLELVFSPFQPGKCLLQSGPALADWRFAIDHLKAYGNIPALTVTVYMTDSVWGEDKDAFMQRVAKSKGNKTYLLRAHMCLLLPLRPLRHMRRFFVHLEWPWYWSPNAQTDEEMAPNVDYETIESHRFVWEAENWLEQKVMGDEYDSYALGKAEELPSRWLALAWRC